MCTTGGDIRASRNLNWRPAQLFFGGNLGVAGGGGSPVVAGMWQTRAMARRKKKLADGQTSLAEGNGTKSASAEEATTSLGDLIKAATTAAKRKGTARKQAESKRVTGKKTETNQAKFVERVRPTPEPLPVAPEPPQPTMDARSMRLLNDAYGGTTPLAQSRGKRGRRAATRGHSVPPGPNVSNQGPDDESARARLGALVGGGVRFIAVDYGDGPVAAVRDGVAQRILKGLRSPNFKAEAVLDLHGQTAVAAEAAVNRFVREHRHCRHLLVVHGKGLHSQGGRGVLGDAVYGALTGGGAAPLVRALAHAHPQQGGDGATAVELM